jgi:hypothetical protein
VLFLAAAETFLRFFNRVFELPFLRNAQKRIEKQASKTAEREKKTEGEKPPHYFVMSQAILSSGFCFSCFSTFLVTKNAQARSCQCRA